MHPTDKHAVLKQYFGYDEFREGQALLIDCLLTGRDCLGVMPTGAGKSICFQVPAMLFDGITLVISPLISLMKDQVNALTQAGINAAFINSSLTARQCALALENAAKGMYKLIYVAPERLLADDFLSFARHNEIGISMLTIDESHCISQWGQDFRPSYLQITDFIDQLPKRPVVSAFTATATAQVREDIILSLRLNEPEILITGFDRKNLYFEVQKPKDKFAALTSFLQAKKDKSGIVYCTTRKTVEEVTDKLNNASFSATRYHAGLTDLERKENQDAFIFDQKQLIVATNAFGMGIDKSNVSFVVHYNMPKNIESYYQEAGRAGRDGSPADCILLYSGQDVRTNQFLIENNHDAEYASQEAEQLAQARDRERLRAMTFYCHTNDCLRAYILKYFGERASNHCGNCSNCDENFELIDITVDAQKILSCVYRLRERYGVKLVVDVLRGSENERILQLGLDKLPTYNILQVSEKRVRDIINHLVLHEYLLITNDKYPLLQLGQLAGDILRDKKSLHMKLVIESVQESTKNPAKKIAEPVRSALMDRLKKLRMAIANEQHVPAFVVFSDSTLIDMCKKLPANDMDFLEVSGVGQVKLERYGKQFLREISDYCKEEKIK